MKIRLYANLRQIAGNVAVEVSQADGDTVKILLERLIAIHPELETEIFGEDGQLAGHVRVILNGREARLLAGLDTPVQAEDQLSIFPPVGGGSSKAIGSNE